MLNEMFVKLSILRDPNMKMCTLVVYPGPSSFPRIMSLKVVFQICFGSIKMMGTRGGRGGGISPAWRTVKLFHLCIKAGLLRPAIPLVLSSRPHDIDGMLGTRLPMSMYTTKSLENSNRYVTF